ncbi:hypothetical protein [Actinosynnema sp. NPDC023587]|uniref:hypothetical protein n=1 Tax=Actinosynnema sp. NPDC023587 TaxID=3154695 RepID=UPI0033DF2C45
MSRRAWGMALVAGVCSVLTACGGGEPERDVASAGGSVTQTPANGEGPEKYIQCMRDNGGSFPSFRLGDGHGDQTKVTPPPAAQQRRNEEAHEKCKQLAPTDGTAQTASPERVQHQIILAQCLRDKGVQVSDPTPEDISLSMPDTPQAKQALAECDEQVRETPGGPGGGR